MTLLLLLLLRLLTCTVASQQYTLRHADPADSGNVGPWGESLRVQEKVRLISEDGPEFIVKLYEGDIASDARREEVVSLSCERMAISHPPHADVAARGGANQRTVHDCGGNGGDGLRRCLESVQERGSSTLLGTPG